MEIPYLLNDQKQKRQSNHNDVQYQWQPNFHTYQLQLAQQQWQYHHYPQPQQQFTQYSYTTAPASQGFLSIPETNCMSAPASRKSSITKISFPDPSATAIPPNTMPILSSNSNSGNPGTINGYQPQLPSPPHQMFIGQPNGDPNFFVGGYHDSHNIPRPMLLLTMQVLVLLPPHSESQLLPPSSSRNSSISGQGGLNPMINGGSSSLSLSLSFSSSGTRKKSVASTSSSYSSATSPSLLNVSFSNTTHSQGVSSSAVCKENSSSNNNSTGLSAFGVGDAKEDRKRRLQLALDNLNNGVFKNIHSAASAYDVNYNSLKNAYYKINGKDENSQRLSTSEREKRIKRAIDGFKDGKYSNLTEASKVERVCAETVRNRYHGRTQSFSEAKKNSR